MLIFRAISEAVMPGFCLMSFPAWSARVPPRRRRRPRPVVGAEARGRPGPRRPWRPAGGVARGGGAPGAAGAAGPGGAVAGVGGGAVRLAGLGLELADPFLQQRGRLIDSA